ncbi:MAG: cobalamin-dependent protein [Dehalococcoidales bacterium]|nr:cobalamin-dependent protein [Dehalococcoidales bacterium]
MDSTGKYIAETIYDNLDILAEEIAKAQISSRAEISSKYALNLSKYIEYSRHDLQQLAESLFADNHYQFVDYISWQRSMLENHGVPPTFTLLNLNSEVEILKKYLSPDEMNAVRKYFNAAREASGQKTDAMSSGITEDNYLSSLSQLYLNTLLSGDRKKATSLIMQAVENGTPIKDIYFKVFKSCLYEVGRLWQIGEITVAHEHFFSAATQFIMSELYSYVLKGLSKQKGIIIAACAPGELHEIGLRIVSDLLEMDGWDVYYLGANMPPLAISEIAREKNAKLIALSVCLPSCGPAAREMISIIKSQLDDSIKILVGGYIVSKYPQYGISLGADAVHDGSLEISEMAEKLCAEIL